MNEPQNPQGRPDLTRRSFLQTSGVVAGAALLGGLSIERSAHAAGTDELKIALVGCGGRGSGAASQALSTEGKIKLVAMGDAFEDSLLNSLSGLRKQHPDKVDVPPDRQFVGFEAYKKAIAQADVVILATPPGFRPLHFEEAVRQGKHIFFEKPVAVDAPGIRKVLAAAAEAKKKNLKIGVGLQRHHQIGYLETIKRLQDGAIGDIVSSRVYWNGNGVWEPRVTRDKVSSEMEYQVRNWYYYNWLSGDHINEQHIHNIDVVNWIKNAYPVKAQGIGGREVRKHQRYGEIFDHHFVEFHYADGSIMYSQCRHQKGCWNSVSEHVQGTKGSCDVSGHLIRNSNPWRHKKAEGGDPNPYQVEHDDLFDAIRNNKPYNEAERGAYSTMTALMGRMATYSGVEIEWDKALNSKVDLSPSKYEWDGVPVSKPGPDGSYPIPVPGDPEWRKKII
jgi:myo-inositol 2-dehydrogenase / D-chiro-inositol 1-dehydrogenase